jgi:protein-S-isoprenylcysteine O-methyltransferase Ste14
MNTETSAIHYTLAKSYLVYFLVSAVGLFADSFITYSFVIPYNKIIAIICFVLGPLLILWAQYTSRHSRNNPTHLFFHKGPYKYLRNPTHLGLLILIAGYAIVSMSPIFFAVTLIGYIISNHYYKKYESVLEKMHGDVYQSYKTNVNKIL